MPSIQGRRENATGNQSLLLARIALRPTGNNSRHRLVAVEHQHPFSVSDKLNMGIKLRFQIADINTSGDGSGWSPQATVKSSERQPFLRTALQSVELL